MGYHAGKQVGGRKIHALVDSEGLPMRVVVQSAAIQNIDGAGLVLDKIRRRPWLELIWADGGYNAWQVDAAVAKVPFLRMEIVRRNDNVKGFVVLPRRWVVERTFSWFGRNRSLAKDFENLAENPGQLRHPRVDPAGAQAARAGIGPGFNTVAASGCSPISNRTLLDRPSVAALRRFRPFAGPRDSTLSCLWLPALRCCIRQRGKP